MCHGNNEIHSDLKQINKFDGGKKNQTFGRKIFKKIAFDNFKCSKISLYKLSVDQSYMERGGGGLKELKKEGIMITGIVC